MTAPTTLMSEAAAVLQSAPTAFEANAASERAVRNGRHLEADKQVRRFVAWDKRRKAVLARIDGRKG